MSSLNRTPQTATEMLRELVSCSPELQKYAEGVPARDLPAPTGTQQVNLGDPEGTDNGPLVDDPKQINQRKKKQVGNGDPAGNDPNGTASAQDGAGTEDFNNIQDAPQNKTAEAFMNSLEQLGNMLGKIASAPASAAAPAIDNRSQRLGQTCLTVMDKMAEGLLDKEAGIADIMATIKNAGRSALATAKGAGRSATAAAKGAGRSAKTTAAGAVDKASDMADEGMSKLMDLIEEYPKLATSLGLGATFGSGAIVGRATSKQPKQVEAMAYWSNRARQDLLNDAADLQKVASESPAMSLLVEAAGGPVAFLQKVAEVDPTAVLPTELLEQGAEGAGEGPEGLEGAGEGGDEGLDPEMAQLAQMAAALGIDENNAEDFAQMYEALLQQGVSPEEILDVLLEKADGEEGAGVPEDLNPEDIEQAAQAAGVEPGVAKEAMAQLQRKDVLHQIISTALA